MTSEYGTQGHSGDNDMRAQAAVLASPSEIEWEQRISGLSSINEAALSSTNINIVCNNIVRTVVEILQCNEADLYLLSNTEDNFVKHAKYVRSAEKTFGDLYGSGLPTNTGRLQWMFTTHEPIIIDFGLPHSDDLDLSYMTERGVICGVSIPLLADDALIGLCPVIFTERHDWTRKDIDYFARIGSIIGTAVHHLQVWQKQYELQILDERRQLSSEIHDNISQLLSTLALEVSAVIDTYEDGDMEQTRANLNNLKASSRKILCFLREEMLTLRAPLDRSEDLVNNIKERLSVFESNWGITTSMTIVPENISFPLTVQAALQLVRILNECLYNTLRHAEATMVAVQLKQTGSCLTMAVKDNGCGFDVETVPESCLGLKIMRERTSMVDGTLEINTRAGGTTVLVSIPFNTAL